MLAKTMVSVKFSQNLYTDDCDFVAHMKRVKDTFN